MAIWRPDPNFYPSPRMAMHAPPEKLAYVAILNPEAALNGDGDGRPDALAVFDVDPDSEIYGQLVGPWTCRIPVMSCITSAGTPAVRRCAPTHLTPTSSAAT